MALEINIDNGGTLTDICIFQDDRISRAKVVTTPYDLSKCFFDGLKRASAVVYGAENLRRLLEEVDVIRYSTTQGTNALVERKGPRLGLILSAGSTVPVRMAAEDPEVFEALIGKRVVEIDSAHLDGEVGELEIVREINALTAAGANRIVVSLEGPDFEAEEQRLFQVVLRRYPRHLLGAVPLLCGSDLTCDLDPVRRTWTAVLNSFLHPAMETFLYNAENGLRAFRTKQPLLIFRNDGDASRVAKTTAIKTYSSGPRGGVEGTRSFAAAYDIADLVAIDVGGTTTDIGQVKGGVVGSRRRGHVEGIEISFPLTNVLSVGAGGSSVFRVRDGEVTVGPDSVGALPGPASFGRGGTEATITDASVLIGVLDPGSYFGGGLHLDVERARAAVLRNVAEPLGLTLEAALLTMLNALEKKIADDVAAFTEISPDTVLLAFGGAGPLNACGIAEKLGLKRVAVPKMASIFSAFGIGSCNVAQHYTALLRDRSDAGLKAVLAELGDKAARDMFAEGAAAADYSVATRLVLTKAGQEHVIPLAAGAASPAEAATADSVEVELSASKEMARRTAGHVAITRTRPGKADAVRNLLEADGRWKEVPLYRLASLAPGSFASGPAIVEDDYFTAPVLSGWDFVISDAGDIFLEKK
jgi:N-methylhydantoinase A/oxoprolinase/acetone carboxylase beta subunit